MSGILLTTVSKGDSFILLNGFHTRMLNVFFVNYTFLGDGIFAIVLCVLLFAIKQRRLAVLVLIAFLSSGLVTQMLKNIIYAPRPRIYFEASRHLFYLDKFGRSGGGASSFPSGHTTSAFAIATILSIFFKKRLLSAGLFAAAILVGYSRIYLAQHFPVDVLAGAFIGILFATISYVLVNYNTRIRFPGRFKQRAQEWGNQYPGASVS
jgi:undecaprenyl-diphosphatase